MARILLDSEIETLLSEVKLLPSSWEKSLQARRKSNEAYGQSDCGIYGIDGHEFRLSVRVSRDNIQDFSVILTFIEVGSEYNLIRHNGIHKADHTNLIEQGMGVLNSRFRNVFHIHHATERYQRRGLKMESFAEPTTLYSDLKGAIDLMVSRYGFSVEASCTPLPIFDDLEGGRDD